MTNTREFTDYCIAQSTCMEEGKPRMELSGIAAGRFAELTDACAKREKAVVGVVRHWDASKDELLAFYQRMQRLQRVMPELVGVIFPVNDDADKSHQTSRNLDDLIQGKQIQSLIVPVRIQNYSWTAGLNGPAALLYHGLKMQGRGIDGISCFNQSFHVAFEDEELKKLAEKHAESSFVLPVKTDRARKPQINVYDVINVLCGRAPISIEMMYAVRNTCMILPLPEMVHLNGYNAYCNAIGGNEDHEFMARLVFDAVRQKDYTKVREILSFIEEPIYYSDSAWDSLSESKQNSKLAMELTAEKKIAERLALLNQTQSYETPLAERDFRFEQ
ncbi:MAG: hypothetical protein KJ955_08140 [Nanoarchaeota archaeon]|nr:hypothetical protein [Nanoarchaeota archaeon]